MHEVLQKMTHDEIYEYQKTLKSVKDSSSMLNSFKQSRNLRG
jgi:hypothetical protein